ncbi:signal recognition particle-docking protein FtsY [Peptostreptococcus russellii]|uniref:signal recognition particle-docking protein FtsY n=1 Tax=Peptostreptococcus russellii TaxID=215200 RepID=UPI0016240FDA|nr:signal recognition particle-docking protein FtsY [Peptostreptococcus russellii]MBC2577586.1 signal recognition particle-docking protein FtsY [Peptostreptococcus russellii]
MFKFWKKDKKEEEKLTKEVDQAIEKVEEKEDADKVVEEFLEDIESKEKAKEENILNEEIEEIKKETSEIEKEAEEMFEKDLDLEELENRGNDKPQMEKKGLFSRLLEGLSKTKDNITGRIDSILNSYTKIDEDLLEELEEILITADVGVNTTMVIIDKLRELIKERGIKDPSEVRGLLKEIVEEILSEGNSKLDIEPAPAVIVMVGVNGVGKTTTIGKLALRYKAEGKKVMLAAADTFRAAASEQLDIWAKRVGVDIIKHGEGADPGAVVFDAIKASQARGVDLLICDTAGRLHNKANLMNELGKIFKILDREYPEAKREVLLVVDATTGQNAVSQAKTFKEVANITGIALTKLDGTAKGGVVLAVKSEVDVPVKLIGVGERAEDLQDFDPIAFTEALFGEE